LSLQTLENGNFQDMTGQPLNSGYLEAELSHDEQETSTSPNGQVVGGLRRRIYLDNNGNVVKGSQLWATDTLSPASSYYIVNAFRSDGTRAWKAPQYWQIPSSPSPFDVGTLVPTNPPGGGLGAFSSITLQTNGVNNSNQTLENLAAGTNVTLSNSAGTTTINASGGATFATSGQGGFFGAGWLNPLPYYTNTGTITSTIISSTINQITVFYFMLLYNITISKVTVRCTLGEASAHANFGIYSTAGTKLLDSGAFDFSASNTTRTATITPVSFTPGVYFFAQSADNTSTTTPGLQPFSVATINMINLNAARIGQSANSTSGGVMPATLGTITADSVYPATALPFFEV
jgi:hypothetical protein